MSHITDHRSDFVDIENFPALEQYLRRTARIGPAEHPKFRSLSGGVSNRVVLVEIAEGKSWVMKQALEKLRVAADWHCSLERIHREALALALLERIAPPGTTTPLIFEDREQFLLAMQAVPSPHINWKQALMEGMFDERLFDQAGSLLRAIHTQGAELEDAARREFADRTFFHSLRVEPYYLYTASILPDAAGFLHALAAGMDTFAETIVHGDFSPKNMLIHKERLVLLDHEVAHLGDPAFDLGFFLAHVLSKAHHFPERRDRFLDAALRFWRVYEDTRGLESRAVRHTLGCLLARVAGRSPLEYLSSAERQHQQSAVLSLLGTPPETMAALAEQFRERIR